MVSLGGFKLNSLIKVMVDFAMLNLSTQLVNQVNMPSAAKGIVNTSIALGNVAILRKLTKGMPMGGLINGLMALNEATIIIQSIPQIITGFTTGSAGISTAGQVTSSTGGVVTQNF